MYAVLDRLDADALEAVAAQAYVEMAKAGYATVAEFHYVHHDPTAGRLPIPPSSRGASSRLPAPRASGSRCCRCSTRTAISAAAADAPRSGASMHSSYTFEAVRRRPRKSQAGGYVLGVAPHSLRAVTPRSSARSCAWRRRSADPHPRRGADARSRGLLCVEPHASGRMAARAGGGRRALVRRACDAHDRARSRGHGGRAARSPGLAPTTEADLGDGTFPARGLPAGGRPFGVGSDSNTVIDPFAELRQLEWSQRLRLRRRNVLRRRGDDTVGNALWRAAAHGGAQAMGRRPARSPPGCARTSSCSIAAEPALAEQPVECVARRRDLRPVPPARARRDERRALDRARRPHAREEDETGDSAPLSRGSNERTMR